jgi:putative phage-type endonuclease
MNIATSPQHSVSLPPARMVQLAQGSPEWLAYRLAKRNASDSAAVMGLSPWTTPYQLWLGKTGRQQTTVTAAMQRGTDLEPLARACYEDQTGLVMQPLVLEAGPYSASLDGMTLDGDLVLEVKCPFKGRSSALWRDVSAGLVPQHYGIQIQHQLMVSGADTAHLWVFDGERGLLHTVERDDGLMERICAAWDGFQQHLDADAPPPLCEGDTVQRNDDAWALAASSFAQAKRQADSAAEALDAARIALVALAQHPREQGAGVSVTRFWKAGNVDYKKVPQLKGVDLDAYRGKSREEVRVSLG